MPKRLLLATPLLQDFGCYDYIPLNLEEAIMWLYRGQYFSAIRSRDMCHALNELVGRNVYPLAGINTPKLEPGDEALVFSVPMSDSVRSVREMTREYMVQNYQLGLLTRVDVVAPEVEETRETGELDRVSAVQEAEERTL